MFTLFFLSILMNLSGQPLEDAAKSTYLKFKKGEILEYRLRYGWFTVGMAEMKVDDVFHDFQGQECYKIDIKGRTAGLVGIFTHVDDTWGAYIASNSMLPLHAYADIEEGKYTRNERIFFDQKSGDITVEMTKKGEPRPTKFYDYGPQIHDLISGYMHLRNVDMHGLMLNDTIRFKAFYDEIFYDFKVVYKGREVIDSDVGELNAHVLVPIIPENDIFPGETPITIWVSADANQLPLKVEADMFFGTAHGELINYKNLRFGPDFSP